MDQKSGLSRPLLLGPKARLLSVVKFTLVTSDDARSDPRHDLDGHDADGR